MQARRGWSVLVIATLLVLNLGAGGCSNEPGVETTNGTDETPDAGYDSGDAEGSDADAPGCEPLSCAEAGASCGIVEDGCGGELDCGECGCTAESFESDCPAQPCMEAVGCSAEGACQYEAVTCGDAACEACADGECSAEEWRTCGGQDACPVAFCDPAPQTDEDGNLTYQNLCQDEANIACGTCGLGAYQCTEDGSFSCVDPPFPGSGELNADCSDGLRATFTYFDPSYEGDAQEGSRQAPYRDIDEAIAAMRATDAKVLIIGGSPEVIVAQEASGRADAPYYGFRVVEGISLLGGFGPAPDFERNLQERPTLYAPHASIALEAEDIAAPTLISGIDFENSRDAIPDTSYGAVIRRSPGLELRDVTITANGPPRSGEDVSVAEAMPASTTSSSAEVIVVDVPITDGNFRNGCTGASELPDPIYVDYPDNPPELISCPIFDAEAREAYGADTAEEVLLGTTEPYWGRPGKSGQSVWNLEFNQSHPGWDTVTNGGNGFGVWSEAVGNVEYYGWGGGQWVSYSPYFLIESGHDARPYAATYRFAAHGSSGTGATELDDDGLWREQNDGTYGTIGFAGAGGGGGSGGLPQQLRVIYPADREFGQSIDKCLPAPHGGRGGSGGCGGLGGRGGAGGAWSIGVLLDHSAQTQFADVTLIVADAAPGQIGSAGGEPAPGGQGGQTTRNYLYREFGEDELSEFQMVGQAGGDGSAGQWGGHGGHGAGGSTVGILSVGEAFEDTTEFQMDLGEPGAGASGRDPGACGGEVVVDGCEEMPIPEAAPGGQAYETYVHVAP